MQFHDKSHKKISEFKIERSILLIPKSNLEVKLKTRLKKKTKR